MEINKIKSLIKKGESEFLEFKLKTTHPMRILNELVAFANTKGGQLIIGVNDKDLSIHGVKNGEEDVFLMQKLIQDHIYPKLKNHVSRIPISKKRDLILIEIPEGKQKPYYVNENPEERNGTAYVRLKDESIKAGKILRMLMNSKYEAKPNAIKIEGDVAKTFELMHEKERVTFEEIKSELRKPKRSVELLLVKLLRLNLIGFDIERQDEFYLKEPDLN
ncbi:ATP-binding protein [Hyphobacterium sp. CCMP332]|nr:ATP-binding protein [Hyphobacterium sp. CCMP332]